MTNPVSNGARSASMSGSAWVSFDGLRWASQQMSRGDITLGAKLVLFAMAAHVRDETWAVWPTQDRIAADCGMTRRGVQGAIDALVEADIVSVERRQDEQGRDLPNVYRLNVDGGRTAFAPARNSTHNQGERRSHEEQVQDQVHRTSTARETQQTLDDATEAVLGFPVEGQSAPWALRQAVVDELAADFPALDVVAHCREARAWLVANPAKRKTAAGMRRFLTGWLTRAARDVRMPAPATKNAPTAAQAVQRRIDAAGGGDWLDEALAMGRGER